MSVLFGDNLVLMREMADDSVDLTVTSPPYEKARLYDELQFKIGGQEWVDWMMPRVAEMVRVTKGLVAIVCEGQTKNYRYSCAPFLLMADLHRAGYNLRKPVAYHRVGISGSGGPDWLRNDWEPVICITKPGRLPWSDNTAMGHPPKWKPGGDPSHRMANGRRVHRLHTKNGTDGKQVQGYNPPEIANPGNTIQEKYTADEVIALLQEASDAKHCKVGGGQLGSQLSHENEAPFPNSLAEFFVRSFCPEGGTVFDPFCGSGTSLAVASQCGRRGIGIDLRESQVELTNRRLEEVSNG